MPWRECCQMDERLKFVARRLEGEKMAVLCQRASKIDQRSACKNDQGISGLLLI